MGGSDSTVKVMRSGLGPFSDLLMLLQYFHTEKLVALPVEGIQDAG